jgi:D-alanine-D-alanine ligase-like ATP-grasp enzyme
VTPSTDQLVDAIVRLAVNELPSSGLRQDVLDRLVQLNLVHIEVNSLPMLTPNGENAYVAIQAGEDVPEFEAH